MELTTIPDAANILGVPVTRVHQYLRDGHLVGLRDANGVRCVPSSLLQDGAIVKSLASVITQLRDARFDDDEIIEWLFREDDSLPGTPIDALRANRGSEVKRRAQVAGF
ncbi:MAG TPA: Rv2175c family DNA-binding protein [Jatrophihabitantaceae bacterium]|jgi:hypothetical protein|nr:Rv2175c family DNA-binding protein [Jatrophihabitantaceae bacterium]